MRILFNIIFSAILAIGLVGFWALFLNLWKPKRNGLPGWAISSLSVRGSRLSDTIYSIKWIYMVRCTIL